MAHSGRMCGDQLGPLPRATDLGARTRRTGGNWVAFDQETLTVT